MKKTYGQDLSHIKHNKMENMIKKRPRGYNKTLSRTNPKLSASLHLLLRCLIWISDLIVH